MFASKCGHESTRVYAGLCRNCYDKMLKKRNPAYAKRQLRNRKQWAKYHSAHLRNYLRAYNRKRPPEHNEQRKLSVYGLTPADYIALCAKQRNRCAICGRSSSTRKLHVDHDHTTGQIRGLLCFRCNFGLDWFSDNLSWLRAAVAHLEGHNSYHKRIPKSKLARLQHRKRGSTDISVGYV